MKISTRSIVILALVSIVLGLAAIYLNFTEYAETPKNATVQFQVGVTVRPKAVPQSRFQEFFRDFFRKFSSVK